jgi:hypothetical protein
MALRIFQNKVWGRKNVQPVIPPTVEEPPVNRKEELAKQSRLRRRTKTKYVKAALLIEPPKQEVPPKKEATQGLILNNFDMEKPVWGQRINQPTHVHQPRTQPDTQPANIEPVHVRQVRTQPFKQQSVRQQPIVKLPPTNRNQPAALRISNVKSEKVNIVNRTDKIRSLQELESIMKT